jgi:hypothetical protein
MKKTVVIFAYSRDKLLTSCVESVLNSYGSDDWKKIIVLQTGYQDVENVVLKYEQKFDLVLRIKQQFDITLGNINFNRVIGTSICFDFLDSDVVLGIEEDTIIGYDALYFINQMCEQYMSDEAFRGVNLGSFESNTLDNRNTYSILRFGLHGQAGALTRKTWKKFSVPELLEDLCVIGWDSRIESYLKTGFLATPNASRLLDQGWGGTHQSSDPNSPYFANQRNSWVGTNPLPIKQFQRKNIEHTWRKDARNYRKYESFIYQAKDNRYIYGVFKYIRKSLRKNRIAYTVVSYVKKTLYT